MAYINKQNAFYRFQQLVILVLHLILLKWIFFALSDMGQWPVSEVLMHFFGMAVFGASLIRGCAAWAKYHHEKEIKNA